MLSHVSKQDFLAEIRETHEPIAAVVATLADDAWAEPLRDMAGWTRQDVLAHVGWWSDLSARVVSALRAGGVPYERDPDFDIDARNRSILEEFRDRDPGEVQVFEAAAFERLVAEVGAASDDELFMAGGSRGSGTRRWRLPSHGTRPGTTRSICGISPRRTPRASTITPATCMN